MWYCGLDRNPQRFDQLLEQGINKCYVFILNEIMTLWVPLHTSYFISVVPNQTPNTKHNNLFNI